MKKLICIILSISCLIGATSCKKETPISREGNIFSVRIGEGDFYAVITVSGFDPNNPEKTGDMYFKLFPEVAANGVKAFTDKASLGAYSNRTIHRVVENGFVQGGSLFGNGSDGDIPNNMYFDIEYSTAAYNFYGALSLASTEFYVSESGTPIKEGELPSYKNYMQFVISARNTSVDIDTELAKYERELSRKDLKPLTRTLCEKQIEILKSMPQEAKEKYNTEGGYWELDGKSTVIGQITSGFEILDAIASIKTGPGNLEDDHNRINTRPISDIIIIDIKVIGLPDPSKTTVSETVKTKKPLTSKVPDATVIASGDYKPPITTESGPIGMFDSTKNIENTDTISGTPGVSAAD